MFQIQVGINKEKDFIEKSAELEKEESLLVVQLDKYKKDCEHLKKKFEDAFLKKKAERTKHTEGIEKMSRSVNQFQKDLNEIERLNKIIDGHERKGVEEKIDAVQEVMKTLEIKLKEIKEGKEKAGSKINDAKKWLTNQELRERELEDNLKFRQKIVEAEHLKKEVEALEKKFGNMNFDIILKEKRKLKSKEEEIGKNVRTEVKAIFNKKSLKVF